MLQPIALLCIILAGYLFKRRGLFGQRDYRVLQVALFDLVLPGAIVYSFARNPHDISLLWLSAFGFIVAFIPVATIFLSTRRTPVAQRAFLMLNGSGLNIGCFCFPVVQVFLGTQAVVPAAMFDIGNCIMVAAGTNVMTQTLLHIEPGKPLTRSDSPTMPFTPPTDRDARRLHRRALRRTVLRGFVGSVPFDTYVVMIALTAAGISLPGWLTDLFAPFANANALVSMLMVGMLMDLPESRADVVAVLRVLAWRLPFALLFAWCAWTLLPFDATVREATMMCCLAPIAVFSTLFTDEVLGNARLAGFSLSVTAVISLGLMTGAHQLIAAGVL